MNPVFFVGAGPGDPELLTLKGARLLAEADLVLYAGSLVPEEVMQGCRPEAKKLSSAGMNLGEQVELMVETSRKGQKVVRLHTGDPSIYGAIQEQRQGLTAAGVASKVVPGVTSALAAAAELGQELTLPGISQTVILTRMSGRTKVPDKEALAGLAKHRATICLYLSAGLVEEAVLALKEGYPSKTPVAVAYRVGWPDQELLRTTLAELAATMRQGNIHKQALILIGDVIDKVELSTFSKLYDPSFEHGFRLAKEALD